MLYLLLASSYVWICISAVSLPLKQPAPKVELLSVLLVQMVICFVILEGQALQAITTATYNHQRSTTAVVFKHWAKSPNGVATVSHL